MAFHIDLEMQLRGQVEGGRVHATCPYDDCDGSLLDFKWWEWRLRNQSGLPATPEEDRVYAL